MRAPRKALCSNAGERASLAAAAAAATAAPVVTTTAPTATAWEPAAVQQSLITRRVLCFGAGEKAQLATERTTLKLIAAAAVMPTFPIAQAMNPTVAKSRCLASGDR